MLDFLMSGLSGASLGEMVVYTLVVTHITIIGVTVYLHRAQAHRALEVKAPLAHFFRMWLWLTTGMGTRAWAAVHRKHHAKCETEEDPHSPQVKGLRKVFFEGAELYRDEANNLETIKKYGHGTPNDWLENKVYSRFTWHGCGVMLFIDLLLFGLPGVSIWGVQMLWIPVLAAGVVNGIGHFWGYRNYDCPDRSTNLIPIGLLIGGEELHNNHHAHATSAKLSAKWYEFDVGWMYIQLFRALGLVSVKKVVKPAVVSSRGRGALCLASVQALVTHRYDVLARYSKVLRRAFRSELKRLLAEARTEEERGLLLKARRLLLRDELGRLSRDQARLLAVLCERSDLVHRLVEMRGKLKEIWERSNLSSEQMLSRLQAWCDEAERSGIRRLADLSLRIRSIA